MRVVQLHVSAEADGGWRLVMSEGGGAPVSARVSADQVREVGARARATLIPEAVIVRKHDLGLVAAEMSTGQAMAQVLSAARVGELWQRTLGDTGAEGIALALSADDPDVAELPWELLTTSPQEDLLELRGGVVARLSRDGARDPALDGRERLRVLLWCPTPENPTCREVMAAVDQLAAELGLDAPVRVDPARGPLPPEDPNLADILHIIGHGVVAEEFAALRMHEARLVAPGPAAGLVGPALGHLALVVLDVCSGGSPGADPLRSLATQLVSQGAPAVLAPARPALVQASLAFSRGLYGALSRGEALVQGVREGRAQVRGLGLAHPAGRASNLLYFVGRIDALLAPPPVIQSWRPSGWPRLEPALRALMTRARAMAARERRGHIGLEHVVRAWEPSDGGPLAWRLAHRLRAQITETQWAALSPAPWSDAEPGATPRLARLLEGSPDTATVDDLWRAIALDPNHGLHALAGHSLAFEVMAHGSETPLLGGSTPGPGALALGFEILWGPRDGDRLFLTAGQTLGRGDDVDGPDVAICPADAPWVDDRLSRRHLAWLGPGRVEARRPVLHYAGGRLDRPVSQKGPFELLAGDLLKLGERTWLRAIARETSAQPRASSHEQT